MNEKKELLTKFNFFFYHNGGNVAVRNSKSMQFFFLENC
jgi:hypothetical protein